MDNNTEHIRKWIKDNLVMQQEAFIITEQSKRTFNQSVATGRIKPFVEFGEARKTRLYLRSDLKYFRDHKQENRNKNNKK